MDEQDEQRPVEDFIDWDDMLTGTRDLAVNYAGRAVRFTYNPNDYTGPLQARVRKLLKLPDEDPRQSDWTNATVQSLVKAWNFRRNGEPVPVDAGSVARLALPLKLAMINAMQADLGLGEVPKGGSATPSPADSPDAEAATSPNGMAGVGSLSDVSG